MTPGTVSVRFICGCQQTMPNTFDELVDEEKDSEGFIVCVTHKQRRYGWRSVPTLPGLKLIDWRLKSYPLLQLERYIVFGVPLPALPKMVKSPV